MIDKSISQWAIGNLASSVQIVAKTTKDMLINGTNSGFTP